ncbi:MAG: type II secretion system F family protein [Aquiluna sp.]
MIRNLLESSGLAHRSAELVTIALGSALLVGMAVFIGTRIPGLALCLTVMSLVVWLEVLRAAASRRQRRLDSIWPVVFDSLRSGAQSGMPIGEQLEYLALEGPEELREQFGLLLKEIERGDDTEVALEHFKNRMGSRSADFLAIVLLLVEEVGGRGEADNWEQAARDIRQEQAVIAQVRAKQGWVLGSAKIALLAPWLICLLLLNVEQNRLAFSTHQGSLVLVMGLLLSLFAYFLTNLLGRLRLPERVFNVG